MSSKALLTNVKLEEIIDKIPKFNFYHKFKYDIKEKAKCQIKNFKKSARKRKATKWKNMQSLKT